MPPDHFPFAKRWPDTASLLIVSGLLLVYLLVEPLTRSK